MNIYPYTKQTKKINYLQVILEVDVYKLSTAKFSSDNGVMGAVNQWFAKKFWKFLNIIEKLMVKYLKRYYCKNAWVKKIAQSSYL